MKVIITLDENNGVAYNNRRLSKDKGIIPKIHQIVEEHPLYCDEYSNELFTPTTIKNSNKKPSPNGYYFSEREDINSYINKIDELHVFYWNRKYPSNVKCTVDFSQWEEVETQTIEGFSHGEILYKKYIKRN